MNYKIIIIFLSFFILLSCDTTNNNNLNFKPEKKYKNSGFALIYNEEMNKIKKLDPNSLYLYHDTLKVKSMVKITNPVNGKSLIAQVKSNRIEFSNFYNSVLSQLIAKNLDLDIDRPYIEIVLISNKSTFVAKKTKTFEEEKNVAEKAPIDGILISDLNNKKKDKKKKVKKKNFSYSIKIADFYYKDTAKMMINRIRKSTTANNFKILRLSDTKYRVILGPFNDIKTLKESFEIMKSLNFENLEILENV